MHRGYAKLHRSSVDNELYFTEPFNKRHAWQDLFLHANFKKRTIFIRGHEINLDVGQLGRSEVTMAKRWTWSRGKVRRFLLWLETRQQIIQQKNYSTTIITILNYSKYQQNGTTDSTTDGQLTDNGGYTTKNDKNVIEGKKLNILVEKYGEKIVLEKYKEIQKYKTQYTDPKKALTNRIKKALIENELDILVNKWNSIGKTGKAKINLPKVEVTHGYIKKARVSTRKDFTQDQVTLGLNNYIRYLNKEYNKESWHYNNRHTLQNFLESNKGLQKFINFNL